MKIYFSASVSGFEKFGSNYQKIIALLQHFGHEVIEQTTKVTKEYVYEEISDIEKMAYYRKVLDWMNKADVIVVEASYSSLSIGHELTVALEKSKPVIVLYCEGQAPHFLVGVKSDKLQVIKYDLNSLRVELERALARAAENIDTRFNFFISPRIATYLDWVSKKKRLARAVYLRKLLEKAMEDEGFEG